MGNVVIVMPKAGFRTVTLPDDLYNLLDVNARYNKTSISKYIDSLVRIQKPQLLTLCPARDSGVQVPLSSLFRLALFTRISHFYLYITYQYTICQLYNILNPGM
jgi:hypothetical protein